MDDEPQDVAQTVHDFNHDGQAIVVWLGAPPCPDFSVIRGDDAPGSHGQEGQKFTKFCTFARGRLRAISIRSQLVGYLVENVVLQDRAEIDYFSHALDCQAVLVMRLTMDWSVDPGCGGQESHGLKSPSILSPTIQFDGVNTRSFTAFMQVNLTRTPTVSRPTA